MLFIQNFSGDRSALTIVALFILQSWDDLQEIEEKTKGKSNFWDQTPLWCSEVWEFALHFFISIVYQLPPWLFMKNTNNDRYDSHYQADPYEHNDDDWELVIILIISSLVWHQDKDRHHEDGGHDLESSTIVTLKNHVTKVLSRQSQAVRWQSQALSTKLHAYEDYQAAITFEVVDHFLKRSKPHMTYLSFVLLNSFGV
jgi:hypothetical protein